MNIFETDTRDGFDDETRSENLKCCTGDDDGDEDDGVLLVMLSVIFTTDIK